MERRPARATLRSPRNQRDLVLIRAMFLLYFAGYGLSVFIFPYFYQIGLTGFEIGVIASLAPLAVLIANPLWGVLADRHSQARALLIGAPAVAVLALIGLLNTRLFVPVLLLMVLFTAFFEPTSTLLTSLSIQLLGREADRYSEQRVWGAVGFSVGALAFGFVLGAVGLRFVFYGYMSAALLFMIVAFFLSPQRVWGGSQPVWQGLAILARRRSWLIFTISLIVLTTGVAAMNAFFEIYLLDLGGGAPLIGIVTGVAALSEIPVLLFGAQLLRRFGARRLLIVGYGLYAFTWLCYGLIPAPEWAIPLALLQGVTYVPCLIGGVEYVNSFAPPGLQATTQGLFFASWSAATVVSTPISGWLYDTLGGAVMYTMFAGVGVVAMLMLLLGTLPDDDVTRPAGPPPITQMSRPTQKTGSGGSGTPSQPPRSSRFISVLVVLMMVACVAAGIIGLVWTMFGGGQLPPQLAALLTPAAAGRATVTPTITPPGGSGLIEPTPGSGAAGNETPLVQQTIEATGTAAPATARSAAQQPGGAGQAITGQSGAATLTPAVITYYEGIIIADIPMVYVPGTPDGSIAPYYIDRDPVTNGAWARCVAAGVCQGGQPSRPDEPLESFTDAAAARYCAWRGVRYPTEAEQILAADTHPTLLFNASLLRCAVSSSTVVP